MKRRNLAWRKLPVKGIVIMLTVAALFTGPAVSNGGDALADTATYTDAPQEENIIDLDSMDLPDEPDMPEGVPSSSDQLTPEQKAQIKSWLSAHGYPPTRAGAEMAYQDYLAGKFDDDPEVQAALGKKADKEVSEEVFIMDSAAAWEQGQDRRQQVTTEVTTEIATEATTAVTTEAATAAATEEASTETEEQKKQRKILRDKQRSHRRLVIGLALAGAVLVTALVIAEVRIFGKKDEDTDGQEDDPNLDKGKKE